MYVCIQGVTCVGEGATAVDASEVDRQSFGVFVLVCVCHMSLVRVFERVFFEFFSSKKPHVCVCVI